MHHLSWNAAARVLGFSLLLSGNLIATAAETNEVTFPDKKLEAAVRKFVFEKRDNDKPLVESDLINLSTIQAVGLGITNLAGLEKCQSLASLDISKNRIRDLAPLKSLARVQYLNLAQNQVSDLGPLATVPALQYIEASANDLKSVAPLAGLTNLASLYLSENQISDITPLLKLPRLTSLYLDRNRIKSMAGIGSLSNLFTLSVNQNAVADVAPLKGLQSLYYLFLENNKITDLTPLIESARRDHEGEKRFAPFLNLYLKGNRIKGAQLSRLREYGVRVH